MKRLAQIVPLTLVAALGLGACGKDDGGSVKQNAQPAPAASPATSAAAGQKVSANNAGEDEIATALEAAGVPNAAKWADEIVEYRPYAKDDTAFAELRDELSKYNPGEGVIDQIIAILEP